MDTVDCVAPLSVCHLLLGRPWHFDLDTAHERRSNNYLFVHKGVHHVLQPMPDSTAIEAEVVAIVKVKKKAAVITPKPVMALLQEGENDVIVEAGIIAPENLCKDPKIAAGNSKWF